MRFYRNIFIFLIFLMPSQVYSQLIASGLFGADYMRVLESSVRNVGALREYMRIINYSSYTDGDVRQQNRGISQYFQSTFNEGPCFQSLARDFYAGINRMDENRPAASTPLNGRPSLADRVGQGRYGQFRQGWLWSRAMSAANQNPNLAMALIGMCGHDDTEQGEFETRRVSPQAQQDYDARVATMREQLAGLAATSTARPKLEMELNKLVSDGPSEAVVCPNRDSGMFASGSLGADIPQELKYRIAQAQAPQAGAASLPSKNYHIYGAAFMACQLIRSGMDPQMAVTVQRQAALAYRAQSLCATTGELTQKRDQMLQYYQQHQSSPVNTGATNISNQDLISFYRTQASTRFASGGPGCSTKGQADPICNLLSDLGFDSTRTYTSIQANNVVVQGMAKLNAAVLYQKWYLGISAFNRSLCTNIRVGGPDRLDAPWGSLPRVGSNQCMEGLTPPDCEHARSRLQSWAMDVEWTAAQHEAGAQFAAQNCTKDNSAQSVEQMACSAQTSDPQRPNTGTIQ